MARGLQPPGWVVWVMKRWMSEEDVRAALADMEELHALWVDRHGPREAGRRYRRQVRQYPIRLVAASVASLARLVRWPSPRSVRVGLRSLSRAPGLTTAIVLTVGIGIGGCTVIFAVVDALFLKPLPYPEPHRLVWIYTDAPPARWPLSAADLQALQEQQTSFEAVAAYTRSDRTLVTEQGAEVVRAVEGAPGVLDLLGVRPLSGRTPSGAEGAPEAVATALVTRGFAARHLGSARWDGSDVLGGSVRLDGEEHTVIGILPSFFGPVGSDAEIFPTLRLEAPLRKGPFFLQVLGRLRADVDPEQARAELRSINARLFPIWADSYQDDRASWGMEDLSTVLRGDSGRLLAILMGAVGMLLLVAVANSANLLLARVRSRRRELAVRRALGASRVQVAVHLLTESLLLATGGVLLGLVLARGGIALLPAVAGGYVPRLGEVGLGGSAFGFALVLAAACGALFGLVPAVHGLGASSSAADLRASDRSGTRTAREQRVQRLLVAGQIAAVVPLLVGAGLLLVSFLKLQGAEAGFDPENLITMRVSPSNAAFPDPETRGQFWAELLGRVAALPEVARVGVANGRPPTERPFSNNFDLEDRPTAPGQSQPSVSWVYAEPGYFETLGVPLLVGRMFNELDRDYDPEVALVDAAWAERFFPGEDAVGRRFRHGGCTECAWTTVVGVVGEVPYGGIGERGAGAVYQPDPLRYSSAPFLFLRTRGAPEQVVARVRAEVRRLDAGTAVTQVQTGPSLLRGSLTEPRHLTLLLGTFSIVALALAIVGLYGITAYSVERRRADIAVRLALGGTPRAILGMVVREGMVLTAAGLAVGMAAALGLTKVMTSLLYEVSPTDPTLLATVAGLTLTVSWAACAIPARRAVDLDPARMLRED